MLSLHEGNGRHESELQPQQIQQILKWTWGNEVLIFLTVAFIKISICLYIFRISATRWLRGFLYVLMSGLVITNGSCDLILLVQCRPLRAFWDRKAGSCWDVRIYNGFIYAAVGQYAAHGLIDRSLTCPRLLYRLRPRLHCFTSDHPLGSPPFKSHQIVHLRTNVLGTYCLWLCGRKSGIVSSKYIR